MLDPPGQAGAGDCRWRPRGNTPIPLPLALLAAALSLPGGCAEDTGTAPRAPAPIAPSPPEPAGIPPEVGPWLDAHAKPFDGSHLSLPHGDIEFLREVVGDARIVALGENTHGTRDFFEMKARILRFLVEEMGFSTFAMEASWPESRRLDGYVRTGRGDAEALLTGLHFWIWRTQSVLAMVEWMREHNEAGGDVGFHGVDMQFPGMALADVRAYVEAVEPGRAEALADRLDCLDRFANDPRGRFPALGYADQTEDYRASCGAALEGTRRLLLSRREEYVSATGEEAFEIALQSLRVAVQYHLRATGEQDRDASMAENTEWLSRRIGPEGRMVLWAHNYHVSTEPGSQGAALREAFGDDLVAVGFSHAAGRFTAIRETAAGIEGRFEHTLDAPQPDSFQRYLSSSSRLRFVLDLRDLDPGGPGASWLAETRPFRFISCCYDPARPDTYWKPTPLPEWYDVVVHFWATRPSVVLLPRYPESW